MNAGPLMKTCPMCAMEIPQTARKCPHCQHFQDRLTTAMYHPGVIVTLGVVPIVVVMLVYLSLMNDVFRRDDEFENYKDQIRVTESRIAFGENTSGKTVAVIGMVENTSPVPWESVSFHVDFLDPAGKRADVGQKTCSSFRIAAGATSSFKVSFARDFPESNYAKLDVRIVDAKDARSRF